MYATTVMSDEQISLGRHGDAEDIPRSALYPASDLSSFVTGRMLRVDGGLSVWGARALLGGSTPGVQPQLDATPSPGMGLPARPGM